MHRNLFATCFFVSICFSGLNVFLASFIATFSCLKLFFLAALIFCLCVILVGFSRAITAGNVVVCMLQKDENKKEIYCCFYLWHAWIDRGHEHLWRFQTNAWFNHSSMRQKQREILGCILWDHLRHMFLDAFIFYLCFILVGFDRAIAAGDVVVCMLQKSRKRRQ